MTQQRPVAWFWQTKAATKQNPGPDYIKQHLSPRDFYRHELPGATLKKSGWNDGGLCPFHSDNKPGSFRWWAASGYFDVAAIKTIVHIKPPCRPESRLGKPGFSAQYDDSKFAGIYTNSMNKDNHA